MIITRTARPDEIKSAPFEELAPCVFYNRETGETLISDGEQAIVVSTDLKKEGTHPEYKVPDEDIAYILKKEAGETLGFNIEED